MNNKTTTISKLDIYFGVSAIVVSILLTELDAGPFDCQQLFDDYPVKARFLAVGWFVLIVSVSIKGCHVIRQLVDICRKLLEH